MSVNQVKTLFLDDGITVSPPANVMTASGSFVSYADDAAFVTGKGSAAADGDAYYNTTDDVVRYYSDSAWSTFIDNDSTQSLSKKTLTNLVFGQSVNTSSTGANATIIPTTVEVKVTNASLTSIEGIAPTNTKVLVLTNGLSTNVSLLNETGTAANQVTTGTGSDLIVKPNNSLFMFYDDDSSKWRIAGGTGSGGLTTEFLDHTDDGANLEADKHYIVNMSGASADISFNMPRANVPESVVRISAVGNKTNKYLVDVATTGGDTITYDGNVDSSAQLLNVNSWMQLMADGTSNWMLDDATTTYNGNFLGDLNITGQLSMGSQVLTGSAIISDGLNVDNIGKLSFGASAGTINGLTGGTIGQIIYVYGSTSTSSVVFAHNSGSDTKFLCPAGVDLDIRSGYGGCTLLNVGSYWAVIGATGYLGEKRLAEVTTSTISAVSGVETTVDTLAITAGTWRISAGISILKNSSTFAALAELRAGITDDGTTGVGGINGGANANGCIRVALNQANSTAITMVNIGPVVETYTTSKTINLNYSFIFTGATPYVRCHILAERIG